MELKVLESKFKIPETKTIIKFEAPWCVPCKILNPILKDIQQELGIDVISINVEDYPDITNNMEIMSVPTLLFLKNKQIVNTYIGVANKQKLLDLINSI